MLREPSNPFGLHKAPRRWSNEQLRSISAFMEGDVVNVSAWQDSDKEGGRYRDYFPRARSYSTTNYLADRRGFQGTGDIFLDLEDSQSVDATLRGAFDVVFNHTTLEHVYDVHTALDNICALSRDLVIIVAPTMQLVHAVPDPSLEAPVDEQYSDYWRFTPHLLSRLLRDRGFEPVILASNNQRRSSVYTFCVASRHAGSWSHIAEQISYIDGEAPKWVKQPFPGWNVTRKSRAVEGGLLLMRATVARCLTVCRLLLLPFTRLLFVNGSRRRESSR